MRIVRYAPQERADLPDMTAMSFLVLGEMRRTMRGLVLGPGAAAPAHDNFIIRGYAVEPQAVPDATIRVRIDPSGTGPLGFAIGAENFGALGVGPFDHGQLMGGQDSAANLEGNATQTLDFTPEAPATYTVSMRFVYTDGVSDNRAFWNQGVNSEFITATDTRHLPLIELRAGGVASDEWIDLADVVWDGVSIDGADITDVRAFLYEADAPFTAATQDSADVFDDFDRNSDREVDGVNEIYPVLRALGRQVMDLKGPDASGGFNWWNRVFPPIDPAASGLATELTKSVRSVDTVTYTVGDGVGSFGDFNGATGVQDALDAIAGGATRPRRVKIVIKAGDRTSLAYTVANVYDLTSAGDLTLEIIAETVNGRPDGDEGRAEIDFSGAGGAAGTVEVKKLILRNVSCSHTVAGHTLFSVDQCDIRDCRLATPFSATALTGGFYALAIDGPSGPFVQRVEDCDFSGPVKATDRSGAPTNRFTRRGTATFLNCNFEETVVLTDVIEGGTDYSANGTLFEGCVFAHAIGHTSNRGVLVGNASQNVTVRNCQFTLSDREFDAIHCGQTLATTPTAHWLVEGCTFLISDTARVNIVDAGQNGTGGTGWGIFIAQAAVPAGGALDEMQSNIVIRDNYFQGPASAPTNNDSGAIRVQGAIGCTIEGNQCWSFGAAAGSRVHVISIIDCKVDGGLYCRGNHVSKFTQSTGIYVAISTRDSDHLIIDGNTLVGETETGALHTMAAATSAAIDIWDARGVAVQHNEIIGWPVDAVVVLERIGVGGTRFCKIDNNYFQYAGQSGGYAIDFGNNVVESCTAIGNSILVSTTGRGINGKGTAEFVINSNFVDMTASADASGIDFDATTVHGVCASNLVKGGTIIGAGAGVIMGFQNNANADQDRHNLFP